MNRILIGRKTHRARAHAGLEHFLHLVNFRRRRRALAGGIAHDELAQSAVAHQRRHVDAEVAAELVQVLRKGRPAPFHPGSQRLERNRLDPLEAFENRVLVLLLARGESQCAVSRDDRRHTVKAGGSCQRIPQ